MHGLFVHKYLHSNVEHIHFLCPYGHNLWPTTTPTVRNIMLGACTHIYVTVQPLITQSTQIRNFSTKWNLIQFSIWIRGNNAFHQLNPRRISKILSRFIVIGQSNDRIQNEWTEPTGLRQPSCRMHVLKAVDGNEPAGRRGLQIWWKDILHALYDRQST